LQTESVDVELPEHVAEAAFYRGDSLQGRLAQRKKNALGAEQAGRCCGVSCIEGRDALAA
jgi:hypothetical protein